MQNLGASILLTNEAICMLIENIETSIMLLLFSSMGFFISFSLGKKISMQD